MLDVAANVLRIASLALASFFNRGARPGHKKAVDIIGHCRSNSARHGGVIQEVSRPPVGHQRGDAAMTKARQSIVNKGALAMVVALGSACHGGGQTT